MVIFVKLITMELAKRVLGDQFKLSFCRLLYVEKSFENNFEMNKRAWMSMAIFNYSSFSKISLLAQLVS